VHVVNHQAQGVLDQGEIRQQLLYYRPAVQVRRRHQLPHQLRPGGRTAQHVGDVDPEQLRIALRALYRHKRRVLFQARLGDPRAEQERLPAARRRRYLGDARRSVEPREQGTTGDDPSTDGGNGRLVGRPHDTSQDAGAVNSVISAVLLALAGGAVWEQMGPIDAAAIGRKTVRLGAAGQDSRMKLVVNVYLSFLVEGTAGALEPGSHLGIDPAELGAVTEGGLLDAPLADAGLHKITLGDFTSQFPMGWAVKTWAAGLPAAFSPPHH
jgi:hypothetical protein